MNHGARIEGRIEISPPFHPSKVSNGMFISYGVSRLKFEVTEEEIPITVAGEEEIMLKRRVTAIIPADSGRYSGYSVTEDLKIASVIVAEMGSRLQPGYLYRIYQDQDSTMPESIERFSFNDAGELVSETAELRWPDGTPVEVS